MEQKKPVIDKVLDFFASDIDKVIVNKDVESYIYSVYYQLDGNKDHYLYDDRLTLKLAEEIFNKFSFNMKTNELCEHQRVRDGTRIIFRWDKVVRVYMTRDTTF